MDFCAYILEPTELHLRCFLSKSVFKGFFFFCPEQQEERATISNVM